MNACTLCGQNKDVSFFFEKNKQMVLRCKRCRFAFLERMPTEEELNDHYSYDYFHGETAKFGYLDYGEEKINRQAGFESKHRWITQHFPKGGRILDIGCADGSFLEMFGPEWDCEGIELSSSIIEKAPAALRPKIFQGFVETFPKPKKLFDVITLWDLLDHVRNPVEVLEHVYTWLAPGGQIGIIAGDMDSLFARVVGRHWYLYVPPVHVSYFSKTSMEATLRKLGYQEEAVLYEGKPISIRLGVFRLSYILPRALGAGWMKHLWHKIPPQWSIPFNLRDVMTVWAQKP